MKSEQLKEGKLTVEGEVKGDLKDFLERVIKAKEEEKNLKDFSSLTRWLEKVIEVKNKREVVRNPRGAFSKPITVITDRGTPVGAFISFNLPEDFPLPKEVRIFLLGLLQSAVCRRSMDCKEKP